MSEKKDENQKKKTLSLKLGTQPKLSPKKNIEVGKTVIVEKKRYKRNPVPEESRVSTSPANNEEKKLPETSNESKKSRSGVILKPLSKDEQKKILQANNKKDVINKIRLGNDTENIKNQTEKTEEIIQEKPTESQDLKKELEKKKTLVENVNEYQDKKRPQNTFGRKKIRERKVTIVTALSDADERTRSLAAYKRAKQKTKKTLNEQEPAKKIIRDVYIPEHITVKELANRMTEKSGDLIKSLMKMGMMATINESIDADTAELLVTEFGHNFKRENIEDLEKGLISLDKEAVKKDTRSPIVTIMGHVDHGKTSLLDKIRNSNVVSGESGGITQHIGAYEVEHKKNKITFIDTPGHAAFTDMRARGANVTDIVILIVAADDGVMPQTKEAISHAKSAKVPIIVAINKCDKPESNPQKIKEQLLSEEIIVEDLSGEIQCIEVSAETGKNLDKLLDSIIVQSELAELKTNNTTYAEATVVEANVDKGRGPVCNIIITNGKLNVGDIAVAGSEYGKVRAILSDKGVNLKEAVSSMPVQVLGLNNPPEAGDSFVTVESDEKARELCELRSQAKKNNSSPKKIINLDGEATFGALDKKEILEVVIKSDTRGSSEAIVYQIESIKSEKITIKVIHSGVGFINESDVALASASNALLLSFNSAATKEAKLKAKINNLDIKDFNIIYELIEYVSDFASGKLKPTIKESFIGKAEVLQIFKVSKIGAIAGCRVIEGTVDKNAKVRVMRSEEVIYDGAILSLKREKNETNEVKSGTECGISIKEFNDFKVGDFIEVFSTEEVAQSL
ncbi:translation initiation factor IF-2 [Pelagibacteraceae bacterium]|nr:translation initiation factor IF-2 [Pelagibacteraceae bacterium]